MVRKIQIDSFFAIHYFNSIIRICHVMRFESRMVVEWNYDCNV